MKLFHACIQQFGDLSQKLKIPVDAFFQTISRENENVKSCRFQTSFGASLRKT